MLILLTSLLATLTSIFRSRAALQLENLALRHQIGVLQRPAAKRPKLAPGDRLFWIGLSHLWRDWRLALAVVKEETVISWHRAGFRRLTPAINRYAIFGSDSQSDARRTSQFMSQSGDSFGASLLPLNMMKSRFNLPLGPLLQFECDLYRRFYLLHAGWGEGSQRRIDD